MAWDDLAFTKMQGVGNDFIVVDGRGEAALDWPSLAITACHRKTGVGADGLLVLDHSDSSDSADFTMRMFNPDGTPDVCGNGLRCIARYAVECGIVALDVMRVMTLAGVRTAQINRDGTSFQSVTVDMGLPRFEFAEIPVIGKNFADPPLMDYPLEIGDDQRLLITALSTGSTHAVTFVDKLPDDTTFFRISPLVENHALFPERTSLMWCTRTADNRIQMRIWERGAGETWGCGTGACAAGVATFLHGYADHNKPLTVASKGGELIIRWQPGQSIQMTGPAEVVFDGHL